MQPLERHLELPFLCHRPVVLLSLGDVLWLRWCHRFVPGPRLSRSWNRKGAGGSGPSELPCRELLSRRFGKGQFPSLKTVWSLAVAYSWDSPLSVWAEDIFAILPFGSVGGIEIIRIWTDGLFPQ